MHPGEGQWGKGKKLNTARKEIYDNRAYERAYEQDYVQSPLIYGAPVIEGYFKRENLVKEMAIRKINKTLCGLLGMFIVIAFVSYYFSMSYELNLNTISRQITTLNDENVELQNDLDRLKSFNNVDTKMLQHNLLQKADNVIEVPAVAAIVPVEQTQSKKAPFGLAVGY